MQNISTGHFFTQGIAYNSLTNALFKPKPIVNVLALVADRVVRFVSLGQVRLIYKSIDLLYYTILCTTPHVNFCYYGSINIYNNPPVIMFLRW